MKERSKGRKRTKKKRVKKKSKKRKSEREKQRKKQREREESKKRECVTFFFFAHMKRKFSMCVLYHMISLSCVVLTACSCIQLAHDVRLWHFPSTPPH
jgi:hypothetical protein